MFDEMENAGCNPPEIDLGGSSRLHVVLRNEVVYDAETLQWLSQYGGLGLSRDQRRLLAWGHSHGGTFTSREYQKLVGTDIYGASSGSAESTRPICSTAGERMNGCGGWGRGGEPDTRAARGWRNEGVSALSHSS
jgi:hypothetical protein